MIQNPAPKRGKFRVKPPGKALLPVIGVAVTRGLALPPLGRRDFPDATISWDKSPSALRCRYETRNSHSRRSPRVYS